MMKIFQLPLSLNELLSASGYYPRSPKQPRVQTENNIEVGHIVGLDLNSLTKRQEIGVRDSHDVHARRKLD